MARSRLVLAFVGVVVLVLAAIAGAVAIKDRNVAAAQATNAASREASAAGETP